MNDPGPSAEEVERVARELGLGYLSREGYSKLRAVVWHFVGAGRPVVEADPPPTRAPLTVWPPKGLGRRR